MVIDELKIWYGTPRCMDIEGKNIEVAIKAFIRFLHKEILVAEYYGLNGEKLDYDLEWSIFCSQGDRAEVIVYQINLNGHSLNQPAQEEQNLITTSNEVTAQYYN